MNESATVLIVEDDPASAQYLQMILLENGYEIAAVADTGEKALEQYKQLKPDMVLMDIILEGKLSGCETALRIRNAYSDAKIIFLSAYATAEMVDYAVESAAFGYLLKPYRAEEILATMKLAFSHHTFEKPELCETIVRLNNGYVYNAHSKRLFKEQREISPGKKVLRLIELLVNNRNTSVSNEQICTFVWGEERSDCTLRSLIHRLRTLLGSDTIKNINGRGYGIVTQRREDF